MIARFPHNRVDIDIVDLGKRLVCPGVGQTASSTLGVSGLETPQRLTLRHF